MGEIKLRGGIFWIRYSRNGRRFEESSRSTRKGDAVALLKQREGDQARGIPVTPAISRLTFEDGTVTLDAGTTKNGAARVFPFSALDELRTLLEKQRRTADGLKR